MYCLSQRLLYLWEPTANRRLHFPKYSAHHNVRSTNTLFVAFLHKHYDEASICEGLRRFSLMLPNINARPDYYFAGFSHSVILAFL